LRDKDLRQVFKFLSVLSRVPHGHTLSHTSTPSPQVIITYKLFSTHTESRNSFSKTLKTLKTLKKNFKNIERQGFPVLSVVLSML